MPQALPASAWFVQRAGRLHHDHLLVPTGKTWTPPSRCSAVWCDRPRGSSPRRPGGRGRRGAGTQHARRADLPGQPAELVNRRPPCIRAASCSCADERAPASVVRPRALHRERRDGEQPRQNPEPQAVAAARRRCGGARRPRSDRSRRPDGQGRRPRDRLRQLAQASTGWRRRPRAHREHRGRRRRARASLENLARLWDAVQSASGAERIGFCLDTCHAHAAGIPLPGLADAVRAITGRIDLVHLNDSRDAAGSGADRHESLGRGQCATRTPWPRWSGTPEPPVVLETPGMPRPTCGIASGCSKGSIHR